MWNRIKEALNGTNFWFALLMLGGSFISLSENLATQVSAFIVAGIAVVGGLRLFIKNEFKWVGKENLAKNANFYNYLSAILVVLLPGLEAIVPPLSQLIEAIIAKNYGTVFTQLVTIGTILWFLIRNPQTPANEPKKVEPTTGFVADVDTAVL